MLHTRLCQHHWRNYDLTTSSTSHLLFQSMIVSAVLWGLILLILDT
ncbi:MAG: hypothetical protein AAF228_02090 [Pseudomonadota bacterium]